TSGKPPAPEWDFLKGSGPSSALQYFADPIGTHAKAGWQARRRESAIRPDEDRRQQDAYKPCNPTQQRVNLQEQRNVACGQLRAERLNQAQSGFNPISHQQRAPDGTVAPAADPWQHQRVGIRAQEPRAAATDTLRLQAESTKRGVTITEMRRDRIANGGLSKHPGGTMRDVLTWGGQ
ncbi:hypothetical protein TSOC_014632, partial [Tetrabaena socialis]